jgi:hypothetical protein
MRHVSIHFNPFEAMHCQQDSSLIAHAASRKRNIMNLALKKHHLAAGVRSVVACCALLGAGLACAVAAPPDRYDQGRGQESRDDGRRDARQQQEQGQDPRSYQRQEQRRMIQMQDSDRSDGRRGGRMTADERRDLRRQINEVGQDIYSNPPRR